jgi:hypothetical protein|tara:strand:+ start:2260 stop:2424 length:165 start_codon:yes stop_codon:yes gene_type:complete
MSKQRRKKRWNPIAKSLRHPSLRQKMIPAKKKDTKYDPRIDQEPDVIGGRYKKD